jgi:hydrogenase maturation protein HypF
MPGGAAAITKAFRMALGYLYTLLGDDFHPRELSFTQHIPAQEMDAIRLQLARQLNTPLTSSAGRLFDAVSAICGISHQTYRAQADELEMPPP